MTVAFDVDGILADFATAYQRLFVEVTGRDDFQPGDADNAPTWDWPTLRGYTKDETGAVWARIKASKHFWSSLKPTGHADTLYYKLDDIVAKHEVYFITSRVGQRVKQQTEEWLKIHCRAYEPTVLIAGHRTKGLFAKGLGLDCYIDDNLDNVVDVITTSPTTRTYLLDRAYNQGADVSGVTRVEFLDDMLQAEGL